MPTRVVLRDAEAPERRARRDQADDFASRPALTPPNRIGTTPNVRPSVQRSISVNFRTALRNDDEEDAALAADVSSSDIRASPRLIGYLSCGLASAVMLVSVIKFWTADDGQASILVFRRQLQQDAQSDGNDEVEAVYGSTVLEPKLIGSIAVASAGLLFNLVILWMHLDTIVCPQIWRKAFCDGSIHERNLLILLTIYWIFGVYVCTSSFSVGEVQANVYFTAWICFFSIVVNYRTWRISAGKRTLLEYLANERETAKNWVGTLICALVAAFSVCDLYAFRNNLKFVIDGREEKISAEQWIQVISLVWSCVGACLAMLIMILFWVNPYYWCGIRFDGRFIEGFLLLSMIAVWFWGLLVFTEVNGPLNGPSNSYFSIWGAFFFAIATFGTWMKENRNIVRNVVPRRMESERSEHDRMSNVSTDRGFSARSSDK